MGLLKRFESDHASRSFSSPALGAKFDTPKCKLMQRQPLYCGELFVLASAFAVSVRTKLNPRLDRLESTRLDGTPVSVPGEAEWAAPWAGIDLCSADAVPREAAGFAAASSASRGRKRGADDASGEGDVEMETEEKESSSAAGASSCCSSSAGAKRHASATLRAESKEGEKGKKKTKSNANGNTLNLPLYSVPQEKKKHEDFAGIVKVG